MGILRINTFSGIEGGTYMQRSAMVAMFRKIIGTQEEYVPILPRDLHMPSVLIAIQSGMHFSETSRLLKDIDCHFWSTKRFSQEQPHPNTSV